MSKSFYQFKINPAQGDQIEKILFETFEANGYKFTGENNTFQKGSGWLAAKRRIQYLINYNDNTLNICIWKVVSALLPILEVGNAAAEGFYGGALNSGMKDVINNTANIINQYCPIQPLHIAETVGDTHLDGYVNVNEKKPEQITDGMIACPKCGAAVKIGNAFCETCGSPIDTNASAYDVRDGHPTYTVNQLNITNNSTSGMCIASLVLGIISILSCGISYIFELLAIIFGIIGISQCNKGRRGKGMAIAGIVLGGIAIIIFTIIIINAQLNK